MKRLYPQGQLAALTLAGLAILGALAAPERVVAGTAVSLPAPAIDNPKAAGAMQVAVLSGGCFWGVQGVFQHVRGVRQVLSGYSGGERSTAQYETVSSGTTGHAESVRISFDPAKVSYGQLLQVFFSVAHDPTQLNRQFPDVGTQYRSAIFYADKSQQRIAEAYIAQLNDAHSFPSPIVTRVDQFKGFYPAEDYHQDFLTRYPTNPYIARFDVPKVENLKRSFPALYTEQPVLAMVR
jgi:peptide-methionine (S)-S-oxide reductase